MSLGTLALKSILICRTKGVTLPWLFAYNGTRTRFIMTIKYARSVERVVPLERNEIISGEKNVWLLSVAYNDISIKEASTWFRQTVILPKSRHASAPLVLIFSQHASYRDSKAPLEILY